MTIHTQPPAPAPADQRDVILEEIDTRVSDIAAIKDQLRRSPRTDADWRKRAKSAIKIKEDQLREFYFDLVELDEECFVTVAREMLDAKQYNEIWKAVRARQTKNA